MIVHVAATPRHDTPPAHGATATPRLPLYLEGRQATRVEVDGPAFLIRYAGQAPRRIPFARIARIVSAATVEWSAAALQAALQNALPVIFLDRQGEPLGYLHATQRRPSTLDALLQELADRPDGQQRYADWLRAERMRLMQAWRTARLQQGHPVDEAQYRERVRRHVHLGERAELELAAGNLYRSALHAYALQQTQRAGARPAYWTHEGKALSLTHDLAELLALELAMRMHGLGAAAHGEDAALLTLLHAYGRDIEAMSRQTLGRLHQHLQEILDRWQ